ncbi:MAG: tetratricopeptide repeat protein [Alphaproteobacteria bacterium]
MDWKETAIDMKSRTAAFALIGTAVLAHPAPSLAFQNTDRCFMEPMLAPSTHYRIGEITRMLQRLSPSVQTKACMLFARGLLHHFDGEPAAAVDDYTGALGWMKDPAVVYEMRGDAYEDAGQREKALADYSEAAKAKPDAKEFANLCWVRGVRGRPLDRALANCNGALKDKPGDTNAREARCFVLFRLGKYAEAIADCDAVLKEKPETAGALYIRGLAKQHTGDAAGGAKDIAAATSFNRNTPAFFALWGVKP